MVRIFKKVSVALVIPFIKPHGTSIPMLKLKKQKRKNNMKVPDNKRNAPGRDGRKYCVYKHTLPAGRVNHIATSAISNSLLGKSMYCKGYKYEYL